MPLQVPRLQLKSHTMGFDDSPLLVIWETTQACDLACVNCQTLASPQRQASELTTEEAHRLLETVREFGDPLMVFTGGDPLKRPDLLALLGRSAELGLRTCVSPSSTPLLTKEFVRKVQKCGVARMSIRLDGPDANTHDSFRGVPGMFAVATGALEEAQRIGLETQIQTTFSRRNLDALEAVAGLAARLGVRVWSVYLPMETGRAAMEDSLDKISREDAWERLRRVALQNAFAVSVNETRLPGAGSPPEEIGVARRGRIFISSTGEIYPSGTLSISAGNVRFDRLTAVYRNSPLFQELRGFDGRHSRCGFCEYRRRTGVRLGPPASAEPLGNLAPAGALPRAVA